MIKKEVKMRKKILLISLVMGLVLFLGISLVIGETIDLGEGNIETAPKMKEAGDSVFSVLPLLSLFGVTYILLPFLLLILLFIFTKKIKSALLRALIGGVFAGLYALIPYLTSNGATGTGDSGYLWILMFPSFWPVLFTFLLSAFIISLFSMLIEFPFDAQIETFSYFISVILWIIIGAITGWLIKKKKEKVSIEIKDNKRSRNNAVLIGGIVGLIFGSMGYYLLSAGSILNFILFVLVSMLVGMLIGFIIKKLRRNKNVY